MAVTYGFYNSVNKDRVYNAEQVSRIFDGVISDGVYQGVPEEGDFLKVRAGSEMQVLVGPGRAWFQHTWTYNDTDLPLTIKSAPIAGTRVDAIVLKVDNSDAVRQNEIMVYEGTPSEVIIQPTFPNTEAPYYYVLAYVTVAYGTTEITDDLIENVVGTDMTPFVAGVVQQVSVSQLLTQWDAQWQAYFNSEKAKFRRWLNDNEAEMISWEDAQKQAFLDWENEQISEFTIWMNREREDFDTWFANIQYVLDGDVAGHLQNEIDELQREYNKVFNYYNDLFSYNRLYETDDNGFVTSITSNNVEEKMRKITTFTQVSDYVDTVEQEINLYSDYAMETLVMKYTKTTTIDRENHTIIDSIVNREVY